MTADIGAWLISHAGIATLVFARTLGLAWTAPALGSSGLGTRSRLLIALLLALILVPAVEGSSGPRAMPGVMECLADLAVGAALGWSAALIVAGARQAGELVGAQAGLSAAALFDPDASEDMTALGHLYGLVALAVFLSLDGPFVLVRALVETYRVIPPGGAILSEESAQFAFGRVGEALALALQAASPVALALTVAGLALGLLGKAAPSLQLMALAMPVRAALGLLVTTLSLTTLVASLAKAWAGWPGPFLGLNMGGG